MNSRATGRFVVLALAAAAGYGGYTYWPGAPPRWDPGSVTARYAGAQLRQTDARHAELILLYELENRTGADFRLEASPETAIMARLRTGGSLSTEPAARLAHGAFVPAGQRAQVSLVIAREFAWPEQGDPARDDKLKTLVNRTLEETAGFALFEPATRREIDFPVGWEPLRPAEPNR